MVIGANWWGKGAKERNYPSGNFAGGYRYNLASRIFQLEKGSILAI